MGSRELRFEDSEEACWRGRGHQEAGEDLSFQNNHVVHLFISIVLRLWVHFKVTFFMTAPTFRDEILWLLIPVSPIQAMLITPLGAGITPLS